ncbi:MAG TPA: nucleotide sugar dehydrogenase [Gammaproteobacteria bacterium]
MTARRRISVIGMGYVGLPVAVAFGHRGPVVGFDIDRQRIDELRAGRDRTGEIDGAALRKADIRFTADPADLRQADFHIVAVPTPITPAKHPDMAPLRSASEILGRQLKRGDIVVYESTVYPGATEEDCLPILERESGLRGGSDFHIGYSPERINPGDREHTFTKIRKIVSGQTPEILEVIAGVYESVVTAGVHRAPSIKVAEAAKVVENTQRDVNIALMNELAIIFEKLQIDTQDVLAAARTKWNFLPFTPGLVGGHCIGIDPYYLTYKATTSGYVPDLILAGREINDAVAQHVAGRILRALMRRGAGTGKPLVTILGLTFKENVPDIRNTRVTDIIRELAEVGFEVQVHDPCADPAEAHEEYRIKLCGLKDLAPAQAVLVAVPHRDYVAGGWPFVRGLLAGDGGVVFDVKGILPRENTPAGVTLLRL